MARKKRSGAEREVVGDNSVDPKALQFFVDRLDKLQEEENAVKDDLKEVYAEVKASGFDPKTLRKVMKLRRMEAELRRAEAEMLEAYCNALGM